MKTTDLIVVHPDNVLFPPWMTWVVRHSNQFSQIHITIHKKHIEGWDFTQDIKEYFAPIKNVHIYELADDFSQDWRNRAINYCIDQSKSERVLFMEQDMFIKPDAFEEALDSTEDAVLTIIDGRIHPCFLLAKRELIDKTSRDFSANPPAYDHFGKFTKELTEIPGITTSYLKNRYFHMAGLTQNYTLVQIGQKPNHDIPDLVLYNIISLGSNEKYNQLAHLTEQAIAPLGDFL